MSFIDTPKFSVGILAGGKSTRMGENKALMKFQNETMIGRIAKEFSGFGEVLVSASQKGLYETDGVCVVYDENDSIGPIEGIRRLVSEASEEYVFVCAADMPFISSEIANYIAEFISSDYDCFVICDEDRVHPLCAIYSKRVLPVIEELIKENKYKLIEIFNRVRTKMINLSQTSFDKKVVRNVNTKEEYREILVPITFAVSGNSGSGKTWLIEKLINSFILSGFTVGVIKHDGQDHIKTVGGTDTDKFSNAGASCTAVFSDTRFILDGGKESPEKLIEYMKGLENAPDVIILEGFKDSDYPKVMIDQQGALFLADDFLSPDDVDCPKFKADDVEGIFSCILNYFNLDNL